MSMIPRPPPFKMSTHPYYQARFVKGRMSLVGYFYLLLLPLVCMIPLEHFRTIDYVHVREGRLVYLQKFTGAG